MNPLCSINSGVLMHGPHSGRTSLSIGMNFTILQTTESFYIGMFYGTIDGGMKVHTWVINDLRANVFMEIDKKFREVFNIIPYINGGASKMNFSFCDAVRPTLPYLAKASPSYSS